MIWDFAIPQSRVINIYKRNQNLRIDQPYYLPIAQVNGEARQAVLKHYQWHRPTPEQRIGYYFNPDTDIMYYVPNFNCFCGSSYKYSSHNYKYIDSCWFANMSRVEVKQICLSSEVVYWQSYIVHRGLQDVFEKHQKEIFPSLEKLWIWEVDDGTSDGGRGPIFSSLRGYIDDGFEAGFESIPGDGQNLSVVPKREVKLEDLRLVWPRKEQAQM